MRSVCGTAAGEHFLASDLAKYMPGIAKQRSVSSNALKFGDEEYVQHGSEGDSSASPEFGIEEFSNIELMSKGAWADVAVACARVSAFTRPALLLKRRCDAGGEAVIYRARVVKTGETVVLKMRLCTSNDKVTRHQFNLATLAEASHQRKFRCAMLSGARNQCSLCCFSAGIFVLLTRFAFSFTGRLCTSSAVLESFSTRREGHVSCSSISHLLRSKKSR